MTSPQAKLESSSPVIGQPSDQNRSASDKNRTSLHDTLVDTIYFGVQSLKSEIKKQVYNDEQLDLPVLEAFKPKTQPEIRPVSNTNGDRRGLDQRLEIQSGGREREYLLHVPPNYDPAKPMPLVVVLHGLAQDADTISSLSKMSEKADKEGFIVAYPNATKWLGKVRSWDADNGVQLPGTDSNDVGFVKDMVKTIKDNLNIDNNRVYATGFSNGGMLAYKLASEMSDTFSAIAVVSSGSSGSEVKPSESVSVMSIHGTGDRVVPIDGRSPGSSLTSLGLPHFQSFRDSFRTWANHLGVSEKPVVERDGDRVITAKSTNKETGAEVIAIAIKDGRHEWPGSDRAKTKRPNSPEAEFPATEKIWEFFKSHNKNKKNEVTPVKTEPAMLVA